MRFAKEFISRKCCDEMTALIGRDKHEGKVFCFAARSTSGRPAERKWLTFTVTVYTSGCAKRAGTVLSQMLNQRAASKGHLKIDAPGC